MKRKIVVLAFTLAALCASALAHDLFLKLDSYFVQPNEKIAIKVLNGSFTSSEGAVAFQRLNDSNIVLPNGARGKLKEADFSQEGATSFLNLQPEQTGNYVVGISTVPREIDLKAADFNDYLSHDGIPDTLTERKRRGELTKDIRERYSKHVKTIFQAGDTQSNNYNTVLGFPVEIVPQNNPYRLKKGDTFRFVCLKDGKPLANQFVMSGYEANGNVVTGRNMRTDKNGLVSIKLNSVGKWYVKFIHMERLNDSKLNYESKWATLTFEIR